MKLKVNTLYNMDCMKGMSFIPELNREVLAIVDPPYGIGDRLVDGGGKDVMKKYKESYYKKRWDVKPDTKYFDILFKISDNQIIWGEIILIFLLQEES